MHRYHARILIVAGFCAALAGGAMLFAERESVGTGLTGVISPNDQALYAEVPTAPTQLQPTDIASSTVEAKFPILVYHIVRPSYPSDSRAVRAIAHTPEVFDAEMNYLTTAKYHVVSFADLENYYRLGTPLPDRPIVISFDDGWSDQFEYAFPILEKYRYTATFFVFTNPIGTRGFLTWDELRTMLRAGMTVGSHTRSHPFLTRISDPALLWKEIYGSKQKLEKNLNITVNDFAYPFGRYDPAIVALVKKAGYTSARGDRVKGTQTAERLYDLNALNAPTTTALFAQKFPARD